jgi:hypothetical protein
MTGVPHQVQMAVAGPAPQQRVTVFFRWLMAIPHFFVLYFLGIAAAVVAFLGWWGALFTGQLPEFAATYLTGYVRWSTRVQAYMMLLTDVYPPFMFDEDPAYPVHLEVGPRQRLNRFAVFFRYFLAIPAGVLASLVLFGATTIIALVAWLIALFSGRLPASLHLAYTAVLRYATRFNCYFYLLTPDYPGGLFGDGPAVPVAALAAPPAEPAAQGYADPAGYGAPAGYGTPAGYATPAGYGTPGGYADPGGYGTAPGYATPTPYAAAAQPSWPANWRLLLTSGAKQLVGWFIGIGVLFYALWVVLFVALVATGTQTVSAAVAVVRVQSAADTLNSRMTTWESATQACNHRMSCVTPLDTKAAKYFSDFAGALQSISFPGSASAVAARLISDSTKAAADLNLLSQTTTAVQYESVYTNSGLQATLIAFDTDHQALLNALQTTP